MLQVGRAPENLPASPPLPRKDRLLRALESEILAAHEKEAHTVISMQFSSSSCTARNREAVHKFVEVIEAFLKVKHL